MRPSECLSPSQEADLKTALKRHRVGAVRLGCVLVEMGSVPAAEVAAIADVQARDVLLSCFERIEGSYEFKPRTVDSSEYILAPRAIEQVLMDGMRAVDEWPLIRSRINNYSVVYRALRSVSARGVHEGAAGSIDMQAQIVLGAVDAKHNVREIIARCGIGEFDTCRALSILLSQGYIAPVKLKTPKQRPGQVERGRGLLVGAAIVLNIAVIALMFAMTAFLPYPEVGEQLRAVSVEAALSGVLAEDRREAMRRALEAYRLEMGVYPRELRSLVVRGLIDGVLLEHLEQQGYDYLSIGGDYELR